MNFVLLAKELRTLRPLAWCIAGLFACSLVYLLATEMPDAQPITPQHWMDETRSGTFIILALFSLMIGGGLLTHETEQGTLHFLDGLPLSRSRIFAAKTLASWLVLAWVPGLGLVTDVLFGQLTRTSLDGPFPWKFVFVVAILQMVAGIFLIALAMVISFTRSWFALVAGLLFWSYLVLRQNAPWLAQFDSYALLAPDITGGKVEIPWRLIGFHLGAATALLAIAWLGFCALGDHAQRASDRLARSRVLRALGTGLKFLSPVCWIAALMQIWGSSGTDDSTASSAPVGEEIFARRETRSYEFLLRTVQQNDAARLFLDADGIHQQVAELFGTAPPPTRIVVDLASPIVPHAAGQTNWTKIRLPLQTAQDFDEQRRILSHETAHVFIEQLGGGRLSAHFGSIRCLHEGLATHAELTLFGTPEDRARHRRAVAGAWSRGKVSFDLLTDDDALRRQRDSNLAYPLGAELARALIETQGKDAPTRLLNAIARRDPRAKGDGSALWREVMQAARLNLERVVAAYEDACATIATDEKKFTDSLPRLSAEVTLVQDEVVVRPKFEGTAPGNVVCFVENDEPFGWPTRELSARDDGCFTLSRSRAGQGTLRYLLGWWTDQTEQPVFEPWAETAIHP